ncbi:hypothetical protein FIBSPDRAFT_852983 [Athelia psychrophila]|uniref:Uncharacterized protein n=1 Tax=Athelia psychrophila TaxID=1759441 RepID=A0A166C9F0_9AGAM|nr:hypothetical protein FIBSPDRAFT_869348 [Fibularhizoctonia sp. CBS 109695]KZP28168.1 hypothetical protein FIBSPDRAFT_852983 [Fibularhizoctonia sp. CBS 109695]
MADRTDQGSFTRIIHGRRQRSKRYQPLRPTLTSPSNSHLSPPTQAPTSPTVSPAIRKPTEVADVVFTPAPDPWSSSTQDPEKELPELDFGDAAAMQTLQSPSMNPAPNTWTGGKEKENLKQAGEKDQSPQIQSQVLPAPPPTVTLQAQAQPPPWRSSRVFQRRG